MVAWINFTVLILSSILFLLFYARSASPAGQSMIIGERAYRCCFYYRLVSGAFELIITANYIIYFFYPLATPLAEKFPWPYWFTVILALVIGIPATTLMLVGASHAGEETMHPKKEHTMYGGIYNKLRHPQAVGEVFLFLVIGLFLNSPFLTLFSLIYFPLFIVICYAEEQDLLLRYGEAYAEYCKRTGAFWPK